MAGLSHLHAGRSIWCQTWGWGEMAILRSGSVNMVFIFSVGVGGCLKSDCMSDIE